MAKRKSIHELIKVNQEQERQSVSARDLYQKLDYDLSHWSRWSRKNIIKNPFASKHIDYEVFALRAKTPDGRPTTDYALTIDFAKKLCMLSRTEMGEKIRRYFIEVEKRFTSENATRRNADLETRRKSKEVRNAFTDVLKLHGLDSPIEYIKITATMKKNAGMPGNLKKDELGRIQLYKITAAEMIASINITNLNLHGYDEIKEICREASRNVLLATDFQSLKGIST